MSKNRAQTKQSKWLVPSRIVVGYALYMLLKAKSPHQIPEDEISQPMALPQHTPELVRHFSGFPFVGMVILSVEDFHLVQFNEAFRELTGYSSDALSGKRWPSLLHLEDVARNIHELGEIALGIQDGLSREIRLINKGGHVLQVLMNVNCEKLASGGSRHFLVTLQDVTVQKQNEASMLRLRRLYVASSQCSHAVVRSADETALFQEVCRIAVEFGGMKVAWIGMIEAGTGQINPVMSYGDDERYLDRVVISFNENDPFGSGPSGIAVREGHPVYCHDAEKDTMTEPWRELACQAGWKSVLSLPLYKNGKAIGVFVVYADKAHTIDHEHRTLLVKMAEDISFSLRNFDREKARNQAERQLKIGFNVFEHSMEGFVFTDSENKIILANPAFTKITGFENEEVIGKSPSILSSGNQQSDFYSDMWSAINQTGYWQGEILNRKKDGSLYLQWLAVSRILDDDGNVENYVGIFRDITQYKANEERMNWLAHFDSLTGLPNRTLLNDRCAHAISMTKRSGQRLALMFLDLDNFKHINESLGYHIGDKLLSMMSKRLTNTLREQDTVSRLGGDDFVAVLPGTDMEGAARIAEKLLGIAMAPYRIGQHELTLTASIGIAMFPENGSDLESLSRCADAAMYNAKHDGRNTYRFFTREMQAQAFRKLQIGNALRRATERQQFELNYQPQLSLKEDEIVGAEVLLRWRHPEFGMISPAEFIPIAESNGLILSMGEWVLRTAARQMKKWLDDGIGIKRLAINLSAIQLRQHQLTDIVMQILQEEGVAPEHIELELTETAAMEDPQTAFTVMDNMHKNGIRVSVDDFGTGYSSLAQLKRFKVYKLKIDRVFIRDLEYSADDREIVAAIIKLGASLGLKTIAEGVETQEQVDFLRRHECHEIQGYFLGKPVSASEFEIFMRNRQNVGETSVMN